jgi:3-hydroxyacyl-[acyl-carrier-protein] dehydratase
MVIKKALAASCTKPPCRDDAGHIFAEYLFGRDFPGFDGHFPGRPVCPAIVQVLVAVEAVGAVEGASLTLAEVDNAKFLRPLGPGEPLALRCARRADGRFDARLDCGENPVARFTFTVRTADTTGVSS